MTMRIETTLPIAVVGFRAMDRRRAPATSAIATGWAALRARLTGWLARERLGRSIAHLDDRLLADAGFTPHDLGLGERLIRRYGAGGSIWAADKANR
jgi:uncharacterized protein YjiS (DUF1127 family)